MSLRLGALLFLAALACRLVVAGSHEVITNDSASYLRLGESLAEAGTFVGIEGELELKFPPGYPALVALGIRLGLPAVWSGRLVSALAGALLILPAFALGRRLGGPATGWAAALLVAFVPPLVWAGSLAIAEVVFALFAVGAMALLAAPGAWRALGAGALLGYANLVKPEAFAFLAVALVAAVALNAGARIRALAAVLGGFVVITGPWIVFLNGHVGPLLLEGKSGMYGNVCRRLGEGMSYGTAAAGLDAAGEAAPLVRFNHSVGRFVYSEELLAAPRAFAVCFVRNAEQVIDVLAKEAIFSPLILLAAVVGMGRALWAGGGPAWTAGLIALGGGVAVGQIVVGLVTMWIAPRYLMAALVLVTILAAHGLTLVPALALPPDRGARRPLVAWGLLALSCLWFARDLPLAFGERLDPNDRAVWAAIVADAGAVRPRVMSRFAVHAFYTGGTWVQAPVGDAASMVRYARRHGVTHLVSDGKGQALAEAARDAEALGLRVVEEDVPEGFQVLALGPRGPVARASSESLADR